MKLIIFLIPLVLGLILIAFIGYIAMFEYESCTQRFPNALEEFARSIKCSINYTGSS